MPDVPAVAEEQSAKDGVPLAAPKRFFLVDPLDGTKEFIARNGEFTVNIALIEDGRPVLGVVYLPATDACYAGLGGKAERRVGNGALETIVARAAPEGGLVMAISRSHADGEVERAQARGLNIAGTIVAGSSLKFCRIAEGAADLYPRFGNTMEWDTAAGQAVLEAAGGRVETTDGAPLGYGKPGFRNPHFIAYGRARA
jgi:3'(2'), 5'-bisphosphate nucleotidase